MAEAEKLGEGGEAEFGLARAGSLEIEKLAFGALLDLAIEGGLGRGEFAPDDLLDARGEFGGDGTFGATENVRRGFGAETVVEPGAFGGGGARGDFVEVAGKEELEERAEIVEGVFDRCAGEKKAAAGAERAESGGVLGTTVFDVLGFVADDGGERDGGEELPVAGERAVGRDDEIVGGEVGGGREAAVAVMDENAELRREAGGFAAPVFKKGGGADDEGGDLRSGI